MSTSCQPQFRCAFTEKVVHFLNQIGLSVKVVPGASGFIDGVAIVSGGLLVDPESKASNVLHEAGHLTIVPTPFRSYLDGNLSNGMKRIFKEIEGLDPDHPWARAMLQASDTEATAWAWACGKALGIPGESIIEDAEYDGEGESIRLALSMSSYLGINGMPHAGFCVVRSNPARKLPVYPSLAFWLQP